MAETKKKKGTQKKVQKSEEKHVDDRIIDLKNVRTTLLSDNNNTKEITFLLGGVKNITFNIKAYLPIDKKIELASRIYNSSISKENGLLLIDRTAIEITTAIYILYYYTDLSIFNNDFDNMFELYDTIQVTGLYDEIKKYIWKEKLDIDTLVGNMIKEKNLEYQQKNSTQYILKEFLNTVIDKLPTMDEIKTVIDEAKEAVSDLDPEKLEYIDKFVQAINGDGSKSQLPHPIEGGACKSSS